MDCGELYTLLIASVMSALVTPNNLLDIPSMSGDMGENEKIKAKDCSRRVLAKRYTSIGQMQKDNNHGDVYFDAEFDDTPYEIMGKYKDQRKRFWQRISPNF